MEWVLVVTLAVTVPLISSEKVVAPAQCYNDCFSGVVHVGGNELSIKDYSQDLMKTCNTTRTCEGCIKATFNDNGQINGQEIKASFHGAFCEKLNNFTSKTEEEICSAIRQRDDFIFSETSLKCKVKRCSKDLCNTAIIGCQPNLIFISLLCGIYSLLNRDYAR